RSLALDPMNRPDAYRLLASVYLAQGRPEEAERIYRRVDEQFSDKGLAQGSLYMLLWPQVSSLLVEAAEYYRTKGDQTEAERLLASVVAEDSAAVTAALRLAELYVARGRPAAARAVLEVVARHRPADTRIRQALDALGRAP
ncbi:MAG: tetratricopeptide repeat protein, partial [Armatimonadota bacterium]|nr:tetratricopeptide repeat protein [Armatimonadota bacterium]